MAKTSPGAFVRQVRQEASKVTWPSRKETMVASMMVFIMVGFRLCSSSLWTRSWRSASAIFSAWGAKLMDARWYVVHAYSGFEKKVAQSIREQADREGIGQDIDEVLVPTEEVVEIKRGARATSERKFFPGYVLVKMKHDRSRLAPGQEHAESHRFPWAGQARRRRSREAEARADYRSGRRKR